jgi:hypothetical protein
MKTNHQLTRPNQVITALLAILPGTTNRTTKLDLKRRTHARILHAIRSTYDLESAIP